MTATTAPQPMPAPTPAAPTAPPPAAAKAPPAQRDKRQIILDATLRKHQYRQDALIEALHTAQGLYGFLTPELLWYVARALHLPPSKVYGVATFYNFFTLKPAGLHSLVLCEGTACYIRGSAPLLATMRDTFGIGPGETTPDGQLSIVSARCLGSCGLAPAAILDGTVLSRLTPQTLVEQVRTTLAAPVAAEAAAQPATAGAGGA
jgi:bidirectional [NiFe] hydrogenase diaphorase subunit